MAKAIQWYPSIIATVVQTTNQVKRTTMARFLDLHSRTGLAEVDAILPRDSLPQVPPSTCSLFQCIRLKAN